MHRGSFIQPGIEFSLDAKVLERHIHILDCPTKLEFLELTPRFNVSLVVVHSQQGARSLALEHDAAIRERHWSGIGYHFWIDPLGLVFRARPAWAVGAHAVGFNKVSLGVCLGGDARARLWPSVQLHALVFLLAAIKYANHNLTTWAYHRDICDTDCPGAFAPDDVEIACVARTLGCVDFPRYAPVVFPYSFRRGRGCARQP